MPAYISNIPKIRRFFYDRNSYPVTSTSRWPLARPLLAEKLQRDVQFTLMAVKQKKFRFRFLYAGQSSGSIEFYNQGAGVFFDNVRVYAP